MELRVLCEGQTERNFVTQVLGPHLAPFRVFAKAIGLDMSRKHGGGVVPFGTLRRNIKSELGRSRNHQWLTTMIDLYALPHDYPGMARAGNESGADRASRIEAAMARQLPNRLFVPYIQVHEFEALVLADVDRIPDQFPDGEASGVPDRLRASIGESPPEDIDDGPATAPSKRIVRELPQYDALKSIAGPAIVRAIGVSRLRTACPHFGDWLTRLEALASA